MKNNYGFVIGSRYTKNGKIIGWNFIRYCISFGGNLLSRIVLNSKIKDMTSGFRCNTRSALEAINLNNIISEGYFFQVELLYRMLLKGFKGKEVPITFTDRQRGKSKMSGLIFREAVINLIKIRKIGNRCS